jgi:hypothetical protein
MVFGGSAQSRVEESVHRTRYYLRNQTRKMKMISTCEKNVRRKNCEECLRRPQKEKGLLESQERWLDYMKMN